MQKDIKSKFIPGKTRIKYGGAVIDRGEINAINKVLNRNWWTIDEETKMFEKELSHKSKVKHSLFVNSGSSALLLALSSLDLPAGSEVIIPAVNFPTAVTACLVNRLIPVFVDVKLENLCIDLDKALDAVSKKTRAVLVVDIAGNTADLEKLKEFKKMGIITILDNCDGYGSTYKNEPIEAYFDVSATSFHAAHIITTGEGGAFFTNSSKFFLRAKSMREWGRAEDSDKSNLASGLPKDYPGRYTYINLGYNLKPIELQAAMGRVQLKKLSIIKKKRMDNYLYLLKGLEKRNLPIEASLQNKNAQISWFAFPCTLKKTEIRAKLRNFLEKKNIETRVIFAGNIIRQPGYKKVEFRVKGDLKNADLVLKDSFFISVHPSVSKEMLDYVLNSLSDFFKNKK